MEFAHLVAFCKLTQYNTIKNKYGNMLDLVLSSLSSEFVIMRGDMEPLVPEDAHHPALGVTLSVPRPAARAPAARSPPACAPTSHDSPPQWNFRKADFEQLYQTIAGLTWDEVLATNDVDGALITTQTMRSKLFLKTFNVENKHHVSKREMYGLHGTIRGTLFCSRVMGLLPLTGLTNPTSVKLRFTLRSPYMIFYAISLFGQVLMFIMTVYWLITNGISLANISNSIFYTSSLISFLILMLIGRSWPTLVSKVEAIESRLPPFTRNVGTMSNVTTIFILVAAIVEHLLSVFYGLKVACACDMNNVAENYFHFNMPWIFDYTPYTVWKGVLSEVTDIVYEKFHNFMYV
ncbi:hypothetical protein PYW07_014336 [Mythimna separata]|uniref:Gustatory receptor n=1 Tax=Mythimna separata TaxID=271217 RepID=A0AAD7YZK7_MYTSE|nr:hypothetical protein PYW07_014336 [Mythimna separata]